MLLTTIALPKTEKYNRKSIDLCLKMTIRRYPVSLQNACGPVGISIELNAKTSRDDVKIATDYNCFAKDRKYNRKSINLRLKLTIRRLSRFLHQAFVLLTNICVQLKLFYPAGRGRSPSEGLLPFILFASSPPHSPSMIVVRRAATPLFASICSKFRKSTSFQTIFQRHN